jgi:hypothetical protein
MCEAAVVGSGQSLPSTSGLCGSPPCGKSKQEHKGDCKGRHVEGKAIPVTGRGGP